MVHTLFMHILVDYVIQNINYYSIINDICISDVLIKLVDRVK